MSTKLEAELENTLRLCKEYREAAEKAQKKIEELEQQLEEARDYTVRKDKR